MPWYRLPSVVFAVMRQSAAEPRVGNPGRSRAGLNTLIGFAGEKWTNYVRIAAPW